jgi:hypothetical protein
MTNMRLKRVGQSLKWKPVLGQLGLIVGGVLIALAVDSWWENRQERDQERAYLEQLLSDLRETESRLENSIAADTRTLDRVNWVLDRAFNGPLPPPDSLDLPTGYNQFRPLTGTQTALVQSGDLQLLRNDSIRFRLIAYTALINATETLLRHTETLIWNSTERVILGRNRHARSPNARGPAAWGTVSVEGALGDPELISALHVQAAASQNRIRNLRRLQGPTADLIQLLATELGRHQLQAGFEPEP